MQRVGRSLDIFDPVRVRLGMAASTRLDAPFAAVEKRYETPRRGMTGDGAGQLDGHQVNAAGNLAQAQVIELLQEGQEFAREYLLRIFNRQVSYRGSRTVKEPRNSCALVMTNASRYGAADDASPVRPTLWVVLIQRGRDCKPRKPYRQTVGVDRPVRHAPPPVVP